MIYRLTAAILLATTASGTVAAESRMAHAERTAGSDLRPLYDVLCPAKVLAPDPVDSARRDTWYVPPAKAFGDLIYVGQKGVSAWVIKTSDGLVLVDALFDYSAPDEILAGLKAEGLDPVDIRYVIVTHAHLDHYGGVRAVQKATGARLVVSRADATTLATKADGPGPLTDRDIVVDGARTLTLGQTSIDLVVTPGHTRGTLSLIFPVHDGGVRHVAALWGGTAFNVRTVEQYRTMAASAQMFGRRARAAGADVWLSNHPVFDDTFAKIAANARGDGVRNAFVTGGSTINRAMSIVSECSEVALKRDTVRKER